MKGLRLLKTNRPTDKTPSRFLIVLVKNPWLKSKQLRDTHQRYIAFIAKKLVILGWGLGTLLAMYLILTRR